MTQKPSSHARVAPTTGIGTKASPFRYTVPGRESLGPRAHWCNRDGYATQNSQWIGPPLCNSSYRLERC